MDFSRLPDNAFLKILDYLPLEECIRVGRVDKSFRRIAQWSTSYTKSLNLFEDRFRNLTSSQLVIILDLCSSNLERIKLGDGFISDDDFQKLASTFSNFECPRLTDIDLGCAPIDQAIFERLIRNNPNVESLVYKDFVGFPPITINRLKKLCLNIYDDASLQTLIGRCPNLEELILYESEGNGDGFITANKLDQFFASIPHVRQVNISLGSIDPIEFERMALVNFYKLPLIKLRISFDGCVEDCARDSLLYKVVTSFPRLQELRIGLLKPTNAGISSLATLGDLQVLKLKFYDNGRCKYEQGIRQLAHCQNLRKLNVYWSEISGGTLVHLLRSCPQLEYVSIGEITEMGSSEEAVVMLESLADIPVRDITIRFRSPSERFASIWEEEETKEAIKKLEDDDGFKIKIVIG